MFKLMIVDDFYIDLEEAENIINWNKYSIQIVSKCENGTKALEESYLLRPDIILTDIEMPGISGIELTKILKKIYPEIKIIFMSSHSDFEYAHSALKLNVPAYITKPFIKEEVEEVFSKITIELNETKAKEKLHDIMFKRIKESIPKFNKNISMKKNSNVTENAINLKIIKSDIESVLNSNEKDIREWFWNKTYK